jgi:hypothetical protein
LNSAPISKIVVIAMLFGVHRRNSHRREAPLTQTSGGSCRSQFDVSDGELLVQLVEQKQID